MSRLARSAPYSTELLRNSGVSGVFRYLGPSSSASSLRAPNAMTSPVRSRIGQISRPRNRSRGPRRPWMARPAADQFGVGEAAAAQVPGQRLPRLRRVADAEPLGVGELETALGQEGTRRRGIGSAQPFGIKFGGGPVRVDQPAPLALFLTWDVAALLVAEVDAGPAGQPLDGLDEAELVDLLHELDRVAALGAAEAVPGQNVVFERKGMALVDCRAEDFFHPVRLDVPRGRPRTSVHKPCWRR